MKIIPCLVRAFIDMASQLYLVGIIRNMYQVQGRGVYYIFEKPPFRGGYKDAISARLGVPQAGITQRASIHTSCTDGVKTQGGSSGSSG